MAAQTETARAEIILNGTKANATLKELENSSKALNAELRKLPVNSKEFADKSKELQTVNTRIADIRKETKALSDEMRKTSSTAETVFGKMKEAVINMGAVVVAAFSVAAITSFFKEAMERAVKLKAVEKNLLDVLGGNKATQRELIDLAKERSAGTKETRIEIEAAEKFLAIQGRTPEQIRKTITAAQDLAVVTGDNLMKSVEDLDGTLEGRLSKGLQKLSKEFKDLTKEQLYHGQAIDIVARKYKNLAEEEMKTTEGQMILLGKQWNALKRTIGEAMLGTGGFFDGLITSASDALKSVKSVFEIPMAQKYKQEEQSLNSLVFQIQATNTNQKERNRLVEELRSKYPEFLGSLKTEDVTNQFLAKHLEEVNYQYMEKIRLAESEDKLKDIAEAESKASKKLSDAEKSRNDILAASMKLLYDSKPAYARLVEEATSLEEKVKLVKQYWGAGAGGGVTGTAGEFLVAAEKAKQAADKMKVYSVEFKTAQLNIAEEAVNSSLQLSNNLDMVSNQILVIALQTKDKTTKMIIQAELDDRERTHKMVEDGKVVFKEELDWKKMTVDQLNDYISKGREADATNSDRTNMRKATAELAIREKLNDKLRESYKSLMDSLKEIEGKNYANKYSATQQEIRLVQEKYNTLIEKALKFKAENDKALSPTEKKDIVEKVSNLEVQRDAQIKQVLVQAEKVFSDDIMQIHEKLRVARMAVTARQVYEVNKKYDDARKEILGAIFFAYDQEYKAANGNAEKIIQAEKNKKEALLKVNKDLKYLSGAQKDEVTDVKQKADVKFDDDLDKLKLKGEKDLAIGKEKIQMEVNARYRKLLEENVGDEQKTAAIKKQISEEVSAKQVELSKETAKKIAFGAIDVAKAAVGGLADIFSMQNSAEDAALKKDEESNNQKKINLKSQLDAGLINKATYDTKVSKLDKELDAKKKKMEHDQAVRAKEIALFNALINVAVAVATAMTAGPGVGIALAIITAALGAIEVGYILSQKVPEAAKGRYPVIGQDDNKLYKDVPWVGTATTGLYSSPTLIAETGAEFVIDPKTTRNLQLNYPGVIETINYARVGQRANGSYPSNGASHIDNSDNARTLDYLITAVDKLNATICGGIRSYVVYNDLQDASKAMTDIEKNTKIG